jgi:hypothetical protein
MVPADMTGKDTENQICTECKADFVHAKHAPNECIALPAACKADHTDASCTDAAAGTKLTKINGQFIAGK